MILFGFYTGLRLGDIASLLWSNIDMALRELQIQTCKTGRNQVLPLHPTLYAWLLDYRGINQKDQEPVFPTTNSTHRQNIHSGTLSNQFHRILVGAGLLKPKKHTSTGKGRSAKRDQNEISFHSFRHTTTSYLKRSGIGEAITKDLIGYESTAVNRQYTRMDMDTKRAAIESLPSIQ